MCCVQVVFEALFQYTFSFRHLDFFVIIIAITHSVSLLSNIFKSFTLLSNKRETQITHEQATSFFKHISPDIKLIELYLMITKAFVLITRLFPSRCCFLEVCSVVLLPLFLEKV